MLGPCGERYRETVLPRRFDEVAAVRGFSEVTDGWGSDEVGRD
jgi:hypothetical protein